MTGLSDPNCYVMNQSSFHNRVKHKWNTDSVSAVMSSQVYYIINVTVISSSGSFISILLARHESSRPQKHIHLVANRDITLIHQKALGKRAAP